MKTEKNMKIEEMLSKMTNTTAFISMINKCIGGEKSLGWAELYNYKPSSLVDEIMNNLELGETIVITDWCFDKYTYDAFIGIAKYCDDNDISYVMSIEDRLVILCKDNDKKTLANIAMSLPEKIMINTLITGIDEGIDSCAVHYVDHIKVVDFDVRPKVVYEDLKLAINRQQ